MEIAAIENTRAQVILELTLATIAVALLLFGAIRLWGWSVTQIALRQKAYESTRLPMTERPYQRRDLTEDWVFRGKTGK